MKAAHIILATSLCTSSRGFVSSPTTPSRRQPYNDAITLTPDRLFASSLEIDIANDNVSDDTNLTEISGDLSSQSLPVEMLEFPRHSNIGVNDVLIETEALLQNLHQDSKVVDPTTTKRSMSPMISSHDSIYANTYVDLGNVDTVGFDYDYTLVHYTEELLTLLYSMALNRDRKSVV